MDVLDTYRYLVGAYYGISEMDEYDLKEYVLKDIEEYIKVFVRDNYVRDFDYFRADKLRKLYKHKMKNM